jgi:sugar/nucleoside kinase (ribokinase family)
MTDLICIGTVGIDLYFKGESIFCDDEMCRLVVGGKHFADSFYDGLGGGATNVAIGVKKHGCSVSLAATIGDNAFKPMILQKLDEYGISHDKCDIVKNFINLSAVIVTETGDRTIINYRPPNQPMFEDVSKLKDILNANMVYMANLPNVSLERRAEILQYAKQHKITTILNIGVVDCNKDISELTVLLESADILIINLHEYARLVKQKYKDIDTSKHIIKEYLPQFEHKMFIITDGQNGSYGYTSSAMYREKIIEAPEMIDATGAGDAFTSGFISQYLLDKEDIQSAMLAGAEYAAEIVSKLGAN